ncbi:Low temperature requirement protein LtrA [Asanoa hainanensis]|uniref:Low temperature requirement protein LtrA n=1 Tax=Asanoa hainanensis TaxID=560556 RepID=A0A239FNB8_9ACTN|nr:low temperature requirement protein A [Asanoa hainanensis]SNS58325.1 Low temperature requirement protein LtrA [Asanoa hainanensis]
MPAGPAPATSAAERHASWLELFFDLVVVVAVAQLAHQLEGEPTVRDAGLFVVLFYAVWSVWTSFTLYANVAATKTRTRAMLVAMFGIAVMAAAIPEAAGDRGEAFAIAYVCCRWLGMLSWRRTGQLLFSWPAAQAGAGFVPWVVSIWVQPPARYWLWTAGVVLDIAISVYQGSRGPELLARMRRSPSRRGQSRQLAPASVDVTHLGERLGLFIIIVLGEAVAQVVLAAAEVDWTRPLFIAALAGFGLLVCLWWLTLEYGALAVPRFGEHRIEAWLGLPAHFLLTMAITSVAAGLGMLAEDPSEPLSLASRWALCGGLALYFLTTTVVGFLTGAPKGWLYGRVLPATVACALLGALGWSLEARWLALALVAVAVWQVRYARRHNVESAGSSPA